MGRVVAVEYLTLDGVMESPGWSGPYFDDEVGEFQRQNLFGADALLLGRVTYEGFSAAWPSMEGDAAGFGERMNALPKFVVTSSDAEPTWNATFLPGDAVAAVTDLVARFDGTLLINGSADLVRALAASGLIDEYRFMLYPVIVGEGKRLWADDQAPAALTLTDSRATGSGTLLLWYTPTPGS